MINQIYKKDQGFTLMELMVTVAIIGILASFGLPIYSNHVMNSERTSVGNEELNPILAAQEEFRRDNLTYTLNLTDLGLPNNPYTPPGGRFIISAVPCNINGAVLPITQCVELQAIGQDEQADDGDVIFNTLGTRNHIMPGGIIREF